MGVIYKHKPEEFKKYVTLENKTSIAGKTHPLESKFGKFEFEKIVEEFIDTGVKNNKWPELEIKNIEIAERMADIGYLSRCSAPVNDPRPNKMGYLAYGTYMITNEALEQILEK